MNPSTRVAPLLVLAALAACEGDPPPPPEQDTTPPPPPSVLSLAPEGPSHHRSPVLSGTSEAQAQVALYGNDTCAQPPLGSGAADDEGAFSIQVTVPPNAQTHFFGTATDVAGNVSACADLGVGYLHDDQAPPAVVIHSSHPQSPSSSNTVNVTGSTEPLAQIAFFADAACALEAGSAQADDHGDFTATLTLPEDAQTRVHATVTDAVGNASACLSTSFVYLEDSTPPDAPVLSGLLPSSPNTEPSPVISGAGEPGTTFTVYSDPACTQALGTGDVSEAGSFSFTSPPLEEGEHLFHAALTDAAQNVSACSSEGLTYTLDRTEPASPTITGVIPDSPSQTNTPTLSGTAEPGASVHVYADAACTSALGTAVANGAGQWSLQVTVAEDSVTSFHVRAEDAAGNLTACADGGVTYVEDSTAPAAPTVSGISPASPSNDPGPTVTGSGEPQAQVTLHSDAACTQQVVSGTVDGGGAFSLTTPPLADGSHAFYAQLTDAAQNVSPCSTTSAAYVLDTQAPAGPVLTQVAPPSPANENAPTLSGTAEPGSQVSAFSEAACTQSLGTTGASASGTFALTVNVPDDSTTPFFLRGMDAVGNAGACVATGQTYVEDSTAPPPPVLSAVSPTSPNQDSAPVLTGSGEAGATFRVFADAACTGQLHTGTINGAGAFTAPLALTQDGTYTFHATATDAAGNTSACSTPALIYTLDTAPPAAPELSSVTPASPANDNAPTLSGTAEPGVQVSAFSDAACTLALGQTTVSSAGAFSFSVTVPDDSTTTFFLRATDEAGNAGACTATFESYVEDSTPPSAPQVSFVSPASPSNEPSPTVSGTGEPAADLTVFLDAACTLPVGLGQVDGAGAFSITVGPLADGSHTLFAWAVDAAHNTSPCSATSVTYVLGTAAPAAPTLSTVTPASPSNDAAPVLAGTAAAEVLVAAFADAACTTLLGSGTAQGTGAFSFVVTVPEDSSTTIHLRAEDVIGNQSACVDTGVTYVEDSTAPAPPTMSVSPASPGNDDTPTLTGSGEPHTTWRLYSDAGCTVELTWLPIFASGNFSSKQTLTQDGTYTWYATLTDAAGNVSACTNPALTYTLDTQPPVTPQLTGTAPQSPNANTHPTVFGSGAEPGATVTLHRNACTTSVVGTGTADAAGAFAITASVFSNTVNALYALATDAAGNESSCAGPLIYDTLNVPPPAPSLTAVSPASPGTAVDLSLSGSTNPGRLVYLFTDAACTQRVSSGVASFSNGTFTLGATVEPGSTTTFYAQSVNNIDGVASACSAGVTYVNALTPVGEPVFTGVLPASGADDNSPTLFGTAPANAAIEVYRDPACAHAAGGGVADGSGHFTVTASVLDNTTTHFRARALLNGQWSRCSLSMLPYEEVSPGVAILFPPSGAATDAAQLTVRGVWRGPRPADLLSVRVNGVAATSGDGFATWTAQVPLVGGTNPLVVDSETSGGGVVSGAAQGEVKRTGFLTDVTVFEADPSTGRVYLFDNTLDALFALDLGTSELSLVSSADRGSGALLTDMLDLEVASNGLLYVTSGNRLYELDPATGDRVELASLLGSPHGIAVDLPNNRVFVTDANCARVSSVNLGTGARVVISGKSNNCTSTATIRGTGVQLNSPRKVVYDPVDNRLYVADFGAAGVFQIEVPTGNRTRLFSVNQSQHLALDPLARRFLFSDVGNDSVRARALSSGPLVTLADDTLGAGPALVNPGHLSWDGASGTLYVLNQGTVLALDPTTGDRAPISMGGAGFGDGFRSFAQADLAVDSTGRTGWLAAGTSLMSVDLLTGERVLLTEGDSATVSLAFVQGVTYDAPGRRLLLSTGQSSNLLAQFDLARHTLTPFHWMAGFPNLSNDYGPVGDLEGGTLYRANPRDDQLVAVALGTGEGTVLSDGSAGSGPLWTHLYDVTIRDGTGTAIASGQGGEGRLYAVDLGTGDRTVLADSATGSGAAIQGMGAVRYWPALDRVLGVNGAREVLSVSPVTGDRTVLASSTVGEGPLPAQTRLVPTALPGVAAQPLPQQRGVGLIDLVTGERVLVSQ